MTPDFKYIHNATNQRLAEMLEEKTRRLADFIDNAKVVTPEMLEDRELFSEAARRLRIPPHQTFNDEYFDI